MDAMILLFTIALVVVGISSKLIGCGLGAKLCGFKGRQCVQVGCGMACRGEVALIVANKGMAMNIVNPIFFGPIIILVVCCAVFTPIMLKVALKGENAYEGMEESKLAENFQLSEQVDEVTARLIEGEMCIRDRRRCWCRGCASRRGTPAAGRTQSPPPSAHTPIRRPGSGCSPAPLSG